MSRPAHDTLLRRAERCTAAPLAQNGTPVLTSRIRTTLRLGRGQRAFPANCGTGVYLGACRSVVATWLAVETHLSGGASEAQARQHRRIACVN